MWGKTIYKKNGDWVVKFMYVPWKKLKRKDPRKHVTISDYTSLDKEASFEDACAHADEAIIKWLREWRDKTSHRRAGFAAHAKKRKTLPLLSQLHVPKKPRTRNTALISTQVDRTVDEQHPMSGTLVQHPMSGIPFEHRQRVKSGRAKRAQLKRKREKRKEDYRVKKSKKEKETARKKRDWFVKRRTQLEFEESIYSAAVVDLNAVLSHKKPIATVLLQPTDDVDEFRTCTAEDSDVSISQRQMARLVKQATVVRNYSSMRVKRAKLLLSERWSQEYVIDFEHEYPNLGVFAIKRCTMAQGFCGFSVGEKQVEKYLREYFTYGGFLPDKRGSVAQSWILSNEQEKMQFEQWLRAGGPDQNGRRGRISVLSAQKFINEVILKDHPVGILHKRTGE